MREFKNISILAVIIFTTSIFISNLNIIKLKIENNSIFKNKLIEIDKIDKSYNKIIIYGSSPLLMGISAKIIQRNTKIESHNLSSAGLEGQFEIAIKSIVSKTTPGDIILIGDRNFRINKIKKPVINDFIYNIKLLPNLKSKFFPHQYKRTLEGDLDSYPKTFFNLTESIGAIDYDEELMFEKMMLYKNIITSFGACPIFVLTPILVKPNDKEKFELATKKLIAYAETMELSQNIIKSISIEDDKDTFMDTSHMSQFGRDKWSEDLTSEILDRDLCNIKQLKSHP